MRPHAARTLIFQNLLQVCLDFIKRTNSLIRFGVKVLGSHREGDFFLSQDLSALATVMNAVCDVDDCLKVSIQLIIFTIGSFICDVETTEQSLGYESILS